MKKVTHLLSTPMWISIERPIDDAVTASVWNLGRGTVQGSIWYFLCISVVSSLREVFLNEKR